MECPRTPPSSAQRQQQQEVPKPRTPSSSEKLAAFAYVPSPRQAQPNQHYQRIVGGGEAGLGVSPKQPLPASVALFGSQQQQNRNMREDSSSVANPSPTSRSSASLFVDIRTPQQKRVRVTDVSDQISSRYTSSASASTSADASSSVGNRLGVGQSHVVSGDRASACDIAAIEPNITSLPTTSSQPPQRQSSNSNSTYTFDSAKCDSNSASLAVSRPHRPHRQSSSSNSTPNATPYSIASSRDSTAMGLQRLVGDASSCIGMQNIETSGAKIHRSNTNSDGTSMGQPQGVADASFSTAGDVESSEPSRDDANGRKMSCRLTDIAHSSAGLGIRGLARFARPRATPAAAPATVVTKETDLPTITASRDPGRLSTGLTNGVHSSTPSANATTFSASKTHREAHTPASTGRGARRSHSGVEPAGEEAFPASAAVGKTEDFRMGSNHTPRSLRGSSGSAMGTASVGMSTPVQKGRGGSAQPLSMYDRALACSTAKVGLRGK